MPAFDFPLEKLKSYQGSTPRPADFDAYWDAALAELDGHDAQLEIVENTAINPPHVACFDLWFTGVGGARIYAKYLRPRQPAGQLPAVLKFHGYSHNSGDWTESLGMAACGFAVAAMDCRGQGGRSDDAGGPKGMTLRGQFVRGLDDPDPTKLLYRAIFLDTVLLARIVMALSEVDENRVGVTGASQGGALALVCAALEPRIKRTAPVFPFLSDYKRVWDMDLAKGAFEELRYFLRKFDPRHERVDEVFTKLGYIDVQNFASRVQAEVLMFTGLMDQICPPSTQFAAFNKLTGPKRMVLYPDYEHENLPDQADLAFEFLRQL
ncbi:acetylxylan esterase [Synoicihabitans lomoniglobus]|uniref:Alpha/beta fold hydrolase n=1 Tax=Synoicihabitans lomoniglobus TaxID=2909285 RepID=A0AAF0CGE7_9BACT|nr:acetylxylan esterase [Opitutaceae bacterium LMO-M01]WED63512.1 alpha/beta fold hydrolase [Opitutaceae bacterium LMO-M01]